MKYDLVKKNWILSTKTFEWVHNTSQNVGRSHRSLHMYILAVAPCILLNYICTFWHIISKMINWQSNALGTVWITIFVVFTSLWYILTQFSTSKPAGTRRSSLNRPEKPIRLCVQILKLRQWYGKSINKTLNNDHWVYSHCQVLTPPTKRTFFKCSQINPCPFLSTCI